jgi:hypothetical protein
MHKVIVGAIIIKSKVFQCHKGRQVDDCNTEKGMKEMKKQAIGSVIDGREDC